MAREEEEEEKLPARISPSPHTITHLRGRSDADLGMREGFNQGKKKKNKLKINPPEQSLRGRSEGREKQTEPLVWREIKTAAGKEGEKKRKKCNLWSSCGFC